MFPRDQRQAVGETLLRPAPMAEFQLRKCSRARRRYLPCEINIAGIPTTNGIVPDSCNSHGQRLKDAPSDRRCNAINATPVENADLRCSCFRRCAQAIIPARRRTRPQFRGFFHSLSYFLSLARARPRSPSQTHVPSSLARLTDGASLALFH